MIASTASSLLKATRAVRGLRFGDAAKALGMKFLPPNASVKKSFANNWLEFHFGWEPLIKDIHDACEVLNNPVKSFHFEKGKSKIPWSKRTVTNLGSGTRTMSASGTFVGVQGARVKFIQNQVLHSLDQWGVLNPSVLVWETIPFSFVVDWFVNVGDFLRSFSDFAGMTLDSTFSTAAWQANCLGEYRINPGFTPQGFRSWQHRYSACVRTISLSGPVFSVKKLKPPSVTRAATAISLLVQQGFKH